MKHLVIGAVIVVLGCNNTQPSAAAVQINQSRAVLCPEVDMLEAITFATMDQYRVPAEPMASLRSAFAFARRSCPVAPSGGDR